MSDEWDCEREKGGELELTRAAQAWVCRMLLDLLAEESWIGRSQDGVRCNEASGLADL
jgi:hypothetical protein